MATVYDAAAVAIQTPGIHGTSGVPVYIEGDPGSGKSARINTMLKRLSAALPSGLYTETIISALHEPQDFVGWPRVVEAAQADGSIVRTLEMIPAGWAVRAAHAPRAAIFLDEHSNATRETQTALLRPVCEGKIGTLSLHNVSWIAAGNNAATAANGHTQSAAAANRWIRLEAPPADPEAFGAYMLGGAAVDAPPPILDLKQWATQFRKVRALVAQFHKRRGGALHVVPKSEEEMGQNWPSPRTWEMGARVYAAGLAVNSPEIALTLLTGAVGSVGVEFVAWAEQQDLPDPMDILSGRVPFAIDRARLDRAIITLSMCATAAVEMAVTGTGADEAEKKADALRQRGTLVEAFYSLCLTAQAAGVLDVCVPAAMALCTRWHGKQGPNEIKVLKTSGILTMFKAAGVL